MAKARSNPLGMLQRDSAIVVRLGSGEHTHFLKEEAEQTLCESGRGRAKKKQQIFKSNATFATCYRCIKLAQINVEAGRRPGQAR